MAFQTYLDELGIEVQRLVLAALSELGKDPKDFWAIEQYGEGVPPTVTLHLGPNDFRKFVVHYVGESQLTEEQRKLLVRLHVEYAYLLPN